jgi:hypothetical protein
MKLSLLAGHQEFVVTFLKSISLTELFNWLECITVHGLRDTHAILCMRGSAKIAIPCNTAINMHTIKWLQTEGKHY